MRFRLDAVDVAFDGGEVLKGLTLTIDQRRVGIIGDNGSGKSTFARLLNGLILPTRGHVTADGLDTRADATAIRRKVGFVFQNAGHQLVMPTVAEDVAFGLTVRGAARDDADRRAAAALARLGLLPLAGRACAVLSGGEKQLAALAGALVIEPETIVFDEPTTMLDRRNAAGIMAAIRALPCQVIVVTHHVELLDGFDRVIVLERGRVIADAEPPAAIAAYLATHA
jgi:biotin transport system ATP-binding protein